LEKETLKFERKTGFAGSKSQKWIDQTFPSCPFCHSNEPLWLVGEGWTRIHFKCNKCEAVISVGLSTIESQGSLVGTAGLAGLLSKKLAGNKVKVESSGKLEKNRVLVGKDFAIEELKQKKDLTS